MIKYSAEINRKKLELWPHLINTCKMVLQHVATCTKCGGDGLDVNNACDACGYCGGTGKIIRGAISAEIHLILEIIAKAEAIERGE